MLHNRSLCIALSAIALAAAPLAQSTLIVDASGGGQFRDIPPAVAAAQPGDLVLVRRGSYSSIDVDKGIRIIAESGASAGSSFAPMLNATGVPAGQTLVVRGFQPPPLSFSLEVMIQGCAGHVLVEDITVQNGIDVRSSRQVCLHDVTANGRPLEVRTSTLVAVGCTFTAGRSVISKTHGIVVRSSRVVLSHCQSTGGSNYSGVGSGSGVHLVSGAVTCTGSSTAIRAGDSVLRAPVPAPAILTNGGTIDLDPGVQLVPKFGASAVEGPASVQTTDIPALRADVSAAVLTAVSSAPPGYATYLLAGPLLQPGLTTPFGELWLGTFHVVLDATFMSASGTHTSTINVPPLAPGSWLCLQLMVTSGPRLWLSNPMTLTL